MPAPTDRGVVAVRRNDNGTLTVDICAEVRDGAPVGTFARHVGVAADALRLGVALRTDGDVLTSEGVVEVVPDGRGALLIRPIPGGALL